MVGGDSYLVDLLAQLVRDFGFLGFQQLAHDCHDVLASCWLRIGRVQVMQGHVLQRGTPIHLCPPADTRESARLVINHSTKNNEHGNNSSFVASGCLP